MITKLIPLISGNAVSLELSPPVAALYWRILRNTSGVFANENAQTIVYQGEGTELVDYDDLENGTPYFYKVFYWNGTAWISSQAAQAVTPALLFTDTSVDPQELVRARLDSGLNALIAAGKLTHPRNHITVLNASPQIEDTAFPVVTVHLQSDNPDNRFISDFTDNAIDSIGWYSAVDLEVVAWCINGDERHDLRAAIKSVLIANLELFNASGLLQISTKFSDSEDFESYQCPIYRTHVSFSCLSDSSIHDDTDYALLDSITVTPTSLY